MSITFIHVSDFHYRKEKTENHGVIIDTLLQDLKQQISHLKGTTVYLAFSGDVVQAADEVGSYKELVEELDGKLNEIGIPRSRRICVPGNHDISIKTVSSIDVQHEGVTSMDFNETQFNEFVHRPANPLLGKFTDYLQFQSSFADYGITESSISGAGWMLNDEVGIFCLNTALCSSGGLKHPITGKVIDDKRRLCIDTRTLHDWLRTCNARWKVLIMHHPLNWLTEWAQKELAALFNRDFSLVLSGHTHDQSSFHSLNKGASLVECSAPPLYTSKDGDLGYALIFLFPDVGVSEIAYRQWTKHLSFVSGVNFSNTDDGKVQIAKSALAIPHDRRRIDTDFVDRYLSKRLDDSLISFSSQPRVWVTPTLVTKPETEKNSEVAENVG